MKKILLAFALSVPAQAAFCQEDSLLKKFKYRINRYQAVGISLSGASQFYQDKPVAGTNRNSTTSGNFGASYYALKSTDKILFTATTGLSSAFGFYKSTSENDTSRERNFLIAPAVSVLNKWFSKEMFTELGTEISGNFFNSKNELTNVPRPTRYKQQSYSVAINTGIGNGRLENVTDMQNALWLNKALTGANSLSRPLSADELNELGQGITKGNNTRVLDARKRTQFALETVDAYLQKKGLINKTDIAYFSNLNDILFFAFNSPRLAGAEKFIRFTPAISGWYNDQEQNTDKNKYNFNVKSLTLSSGFSRYIPTSLTHQNNYGVSAKLSYEYTDLSIKFLTNGTVTNENGGTADLKRAGLNLFYQHAIYPNTRTTINFNLQGDVGYQDFNSESGFYGIGNFNCGLNYFISYRTRFTLNLGADYQQNNYVFEQQPLRQQPSILQLYANAGVQVNL